MVSGKKNDDIIIMWIYWLIFCFKYRVSPFVAYVENDELEEIWSDYYMKWIKKRNKIYDK